MYFKWLKAEITCYLNKTVISFDEVFHSTRRIDEFKFFKGIPTILSKLAEFDVFINFTPENINPYNNCTIAHVFNLFSLYRSLQRDHQ